MTVFRVEHKVDEIGPYRIDWQWMKTKESHCVSNGHPGPRDDEFIQASTSELKDVFFDFVSHFHVTDTIESLHYGFVSMESLTSWFSKEEYFELLKKEFIVRVYEAKEWIILKKQVLFKKGQCVTEIEKIY